MVNAQNQKVVAVTLPGAIVDNAAFTTATIDTLGYGYLTVLCIFGAMDIAMAALKVQESDSSNMSGAADITGAVYGTSTDISGATSALPADTADNTIYGFEIALGNGRKRYIDISATGGDGSAGTYLTIVALLSRAKNPATTASGRGFANILRVN